MKRNLKVLASLLAVTLTGCGGSNHPLIGNKFLLSDSAPTEKYQSGYDRNSYFALLAGLSDSVSTIDKLNSAVRTFFGDGFVSITSTVYEITVTGSSPISSYLSYNSDNTQQIFALMSPSDNKGIDSESLYMLGNNGNPLVLSSFFSSGTSGSASYVINAYTFAKVNNSYEALFVSQYKSSSTEKSVIAASFTYSFTKSK